MDGDIVVSIRNLLGHPPRGLHISDIASRLKISRESVSKYLEVLEATGQVESWNHGTARVFCLSRRVPATALLSLSSDLVCMLDNQRSLIYANDTFLEYFGLEGPKVKGLHIVEIASDRFSRPAFPELFSDLLAGEEHVQDVALQGESGECFLKVRGIPTIFDDGSGGTTVIMEDVTRDRHYVRNLEFLARTSADLADMGDDADIYGYIADQVYQLEPGSTVSVSTMNDAKTMLTVRAVAGDPDVISRFWAIIGKNPVGLTFPFQGEPLAAESLAKKTLVKVPSLLSALFNDVPPEVACQIGAAMSFGKGYAIGCVCRGGLYGDVAIFLKKGQELRHKELIETFLGQAAVALQRRYMREKLRATEDRVRQLEAGLNPA